MIIKIIIFGLIGIFIYKLFGGKFPSLLRSADEKKLDNDTLVECVTCHTFVTQKESIKVGENCFCSLECKTKN